MNVGRNYNDPKVLDLSSKDESRKTRIVMRLILITSGKTESTRKKITMLPRPAAMQVKSTWLQETIRHAPVSTNKKSLLDENIVLRKE